jgi:hypothetical protein
MAHVEGPSRSLSLDMCSAYTRSIRSRSHKDTNFGGASRRERRPAWPNLTLGCGSHSHELRWTASARSAMDERVNALRTWTLVGGPLRIRGWTPSTSRSVTTACRFQARAFLESGVAQDVIAWTLARSSPGASGRSSSVDLGRGRDRCALVISDQHDDLSSGPLMCPMAAPHGALGRRCSPTAAATNAA